MNFTFRPIVPADRQLIDKLFLDEAYRSKGGGAKIMHFANSQAKELGLACLYLEGTETTTRARGIYERRGFAPTGHMPMSKRTAP